MAGVRELTGGIAAQIAVEVNEDGSVRGETLDHVNVGVVVGVGFRSGAGEPGVNVLGVERHGDVINHESDGYVVAFEG